ncbi:MAG TPA: F0F1 ATP synthase subunit epsilon [Candidatus Acidoferrales bacterium]|nr:F0F1 ATP synthase subunit epsilon [Candidatus Acidoferrales bacterium]
MAEILHLEVVTPERSVVHADASEVQLPGRDGYLGVLPGHAPLLTEAGIGELSYKSGSGTEYIALIGGFAEVLPDGVIVLAESAERPEEINTERARTEKQAAEKILATPNITLQQADEARVAVRRAEVRMQVAARASQSVPGSAAHH